MAFYNPNKSCQIPDLSAIYESIFGKKTNGTFCEVGAYDGNAFSNTSFLADRGWRGLYIEPVPEFADACAKRHACNDVIVIRRCAGEQKTVTLHLGGTLTTTNKNYLHAYNEISWSKGMHTGETLQVKQERLDTLLARAGFKPDFDVLVVDVEGAEPEVFSSFELHKWMPKVLIVELEDEHVSFQGYNQITERCCELRSKIIKAGYTELYRDMINTIFLRQDRSNALIGRKSP